MIQHSRQQITTRPVRGENTIVDCPIRGPVSVDVCFYCRSMEAVDLDGATPRVYCRAKDNIPTRRERLAYRWLSMFQLAEEHGNVTQICRDNSVSRSRFYRYKKVFNREGFSGLLRISLR